MKTENSTYNKLFFFFLREDKVLFSATFIAISIFWGSSISFAQPTLQWAKNMGGTGDDYGGSIAVDASGNIYTTGRFQNTADFDPGAGTYNLTSAGSDDIFVSKLDASGNFIWAKRMGGTGSDLSNSMVIDALGNVYTIGKFQNTADFDPGAGTYNLTSAGSEDIFVSKLDAAGNFVWAKRMGGTGWDIGHSIAVDVSGNVHTTGFFQNTADFDPGAGIVNLISAGSYDIFVSKLDVSGNLVWAKRMGGSAWDQGKSIVLDASGNIYTTGIFQSTPADFDPGAGVYNLTAAGNVDIFISKLDATGNFVWAKRMGGTSADYGNSIAIDASGNIYTTGYFVGTADFDPGAGTANLTAISGNYDIYISKLDASGNYLNAVVMGGAGREYANSITLDASGNIFIIGDQYAPVVDYDPGGGVFNLTNLGIEANFIAKYDNNCNFKCAFLLTPGHNETYSDHQIAVVGLNLYFTVSIYGPTADFDPCTPIYNLPNNGLYDIAVAKYDMSSCNCSPMPIELLSFTGINKGNYNLLRWQTASETNNDYFTVEASPSPSKGGEMEWEAIGSVEGAGNSNQTQSYSYIDNSPSQWEGVGGWAYYRLKQTDFDGRYEYSNIIAVEMQQGGDVGMFEIYPNPAEDHFNFSFNAGSSPENLSLTITDAVGLQVQHRQYNKLEGNTIHTVELNGLEKGIYYVLFKSDDWETTHKLIVVK